MAVRKLTHSVPYFVAEIALLGDFFEYSVFRLMLLHGQKAVFNCISFLVFILFKKIFSNLLKQQFVKCHKNILPVVDN